MTSASEASVREPHSGPARCAATAEDNAASASREVDPSDIVTSSAQSLQPPAVAIAPGSPAQEPKGANAKQLLLQGLVVAGAVALGTLVPKLLGDGGSKREQSPPKRGEGRLDVLSLAADIRKAAGFPAHADEEANGSLQQEASSQGAAAASPAPAPPAETAAEIVARHEAALLRRTYESMHAEFASSGLDIPAIERSQPNFHSGTDAGSNDPREVPTRWPAKYERMSPPYPPNAVRLVVAPIQPNNAAMASILANATAQVLRALPPSTPLYINPTSKLHVTAFFMSEPHDTRPDPLQPGGGCALSLPVRQRPAPTEDAVAREVAVVRHLAADTPATRLRLERIVLARSGCLLATWTEVAEGLPLAQFKAACREAFAGAPPRSPRIYHSTLVRLLTSRQFSEAERKRVVDVCESLTEKLRGREIDVGLLWLCIEQEWSNLEGPTRVIKMQV